MALYHWSLTAGANGTADPQINYAENQAPSSLNDSARAAMSVIRAYANDIAGSIVTTGTSTAYIVASSSVFDTAAHANGQLVAFTPHVTNGPGPNTLSVDAIGVKPLRLSPNVELQSGVLIQGTPYAALFNNTDGAWYLQSIGGNAYGIPLGGGIDFWGTTAPSSALALPYGQAISRTTYASLFSLVGTTFGVGDGSTTFNIPDCRGRVIAGLDNMGGSTAGRLTSTFFGASSGQAGTTLGAVGGGESHTLTTAELAVHGHNVTDPGHTHNFSDPNQMDGLAIGVAGASDWASGVHNIRTINGNLTIVANATGLTIQTLAAATPIRL